MFGLYSPYNFLANDDVQDSYLQAQNVEGEIRFSFLKNSFQFL